MTKAKATKISPHYVKEPQVLKHRVNYKMVDPTILDTKQFTFGMVVVEPEGVCEPGHAHEEQEEIMFALTGKGVIIVGDEKEEIEIGPKEGVFVPKCVYHGVKNPYNTPFEMLWIISPPGWVFDKHPNWEEKAKQGEPLDK